MKNIHNKLTFLILLSLIVSTSILISYVVLLQNNTFSNKILDLPSNKLNKNTSTELIQKCPDAWYMNNMPIVIDDTNLSETDIIPIDNRQYFIIDDTKYDYNKVDVNWVKSNCEVKEPMVVW